MTLAILLAAIATIIIGSLAWIWPSPRERQQMLLRQEALRLGLSTRIVDLATVIDVQRGEPTHCIAYGWLRAAELKANRWQVARQCGQAQSLANEGLPAGWYWSQGDVPSLMIQQYLHEILPSLSQDFLAIESTPSGTMIYWKEHGKVEQVQRIATILKKLAELENQCLQQEID
jgi:hypothetical protein